VYGDELEEFELAILSLGNGIGLEIFEFVKPRYSGPEKRNDFNSDTYTRGDTFHFCLTVPDVDVAAAEAVRRGGKLVGSATEPTRDEKAQYLLDPWGNVVELLTCSLQTLALKGVVSQMRAGQDNA